MCKVVRSGLAVTSSKIRGYRIKSLAERLKATFTHSLLGEHTAYVERTNLTSRQMNGRLVRKTLSFSKELRFLKAASVLEDALYNFTRPLKTLRIALPNPSKHVCWQQRTPAMAARITDHIWTVKELLTVVLGPRPTHT